MGLRICMVSPFAWSQPHPVNEHVAGAAQELRRRGHEVVVLAPSNRAADLASGRRALRRLARERKPLPELVALGPALPVSRRSSLGVPLGVRADLALALSADPFDVVHAHDPGLPSLSYLALRGAGGLTVATFHSTERLTYPPGRRRREKLLARVDALTATSDEVLAAARERFPGDYVRVPLGIDEGLFRPGRPLRRFVVEWRPDEAPRTRAVLRALGGLQDWELVVLRTRPLSGRPYVPRAVRARVSVRTALDGTTRAVEVRGAARGGRKSRQPHAASRSSRRRVPRSSRTSSAQSSPGSPRTSRGGGGGRRRRRGAPRARPRSRWPTRSSATSTGRSSRGGAGRPRPTRSPTAPTSSATCTCTRSTRTTAPCP